MKRFNPVLIALSFAALTIPAFAQTTVNITATDATAAETWPGQTPNPANVRVTRTGSTTSALTVWVKVSGTAVRNADYAFGATVSAYVIIPTGSAHLDIPINILDDTVTEVAETVRVELDDETGSGTPVPYVIGTYDRAEIDLLDNDDPATPPRAAVSVAALISPASEGANGTPVPGAFRITRSVNTNLAVTVTYAIGGTAASGGDFIPLSGSVVVSAGETSVDVIVLPADDAIRESPETVTLTILPSSCPGIFPPPPECYTIGVPASASLTILDNEIPPPPPTVTLGLAQDTNVFGFPAVVNGSFSATAANGYIASYVVRLDGVVKFSGPTGYSNPPPNGTPFLLNFAISNLTGGTHQFQVTAMDDQGLSTATNRALFISAIQPPPPPPATYEIVALDSEAAETLPGEPPNAGRFRFTMTGTPGELEFFSYSFTGSARENIDYTVSYGPSIFTTNGVTNIVTQEITIVPLDDVLPEGTETVKMQLCFPIIVMIYGVGAPIGVSCTGDVPGLNATVNLLDNDTNPPPFAVVSVAATDADAQEVSPLSGEPQNPGAFTITRSAPLTNDMIVNYSLTGTAQNGADYSLLAGVAVIPTGSTSTTIVVDPVFDTLHEGNQAVTLTLRPAATNAPVNYLLDPGLINTATVVIRDYAPTNLPVMRIKVIDAQAVEQNSASPHAIFRVERIGSLSNALTVPYAITGTASNGLDYVALPGFVTLPAAGRAATITIIPYLDNETEPDETVIVTLQPPPADVFPPPYLLGNSGTMMISAGATIREDAPIVVPYALSRYERALRLRFPSRYRVVIIPLPVLPEGEPFAGAPAKTWAVEASTDLLVWEQIGETEDPEEFMDVNAGNFEKRFYRVREVPTVAP